MERRNKTRKKTAVLVTASLIVMGLAAGLFVLVGLTVYRTTEKYQQPDGPVRGFHNAQISFAGLIGRQLAAADLKPYLTDILDPHVVGVAGKALYVASWKEDALYRVDLQQNQKRLLTDGLSQVSGIVQGKDERLVATVYGENRVVVIDAKSGKITPLATDLGGPRGISLARDGSYYVANEGSGTIVKILPDGTVSQVAEGLRLPVGVVADSDNTLLVTQRGDAAEAVIVIADNGTKRLQLSGITEAGGLFRDDERNTIMTAVVGDKGAFLLWPRGRPEAVPLLLSDLPQLWGVATDGQGLFTSSPERNLVYRVELPR